MYELPLQLFFPLLALHKLELQLSQQLLRLCWWGGLK
jgi:hypothetical protein